jgi:hypothetical protein
MFQENCLLLPSFHWTSWSTYIRSQLYSKVLASAYPHISIRVVFRPSNCRLSSFFPFKDRIVTLPCMRWHVVYQFTCQCCSALYVGQTRRHIHARISQSIWESRLWLEKNALSQPCLVYSHTNTCTNTQSPLLISKSYHQALLSGIFLTLSSMLI